LHTLQKFQRTVRLALAKKREEEAGKNIFFFNEPGTATLKNFSFQKSRADLIIKSPNEEPMTPGTSKSKMSFFDVVKRLNPFKNNRKMAFQIDEEPNTQRAAELALEL
jgi:hypothetical protein